MVRSGDGAGGRRLVRVPIVRPTDAAVARSLARRLAAERGFDRLLASSIGIVASELATNAVRHAGGGEMEIDALGERFVVRCADRGAAIRQCRAGCPSASAPDRNSSATARWRSRS